MKKLACSLFALMMIFGVAVQAQPPAPVAGTTAGVNWTPTLVAVPVVIAVIAGVASGGSDDNRTGQAHN
ncbi:MAG: hypothetical protein JJU12_05450 [Chlamydiales bacterium]|nr:hypothetical protein [Chlamydiales bacterium]